MFSRGENGEIKVRITPVDAIDTQKNQAYSILISYKPGVQNPTDRPLEYIYQHLKLHNHKSESTTSPNASNYRTVYPPRNAAKICDPLRFDVNLWGSSHEVGHMNQTRPGLKWT